jgi:hypothetical protein
MNKYLLLTFFLFISIQAFSQNNCDEKFQSSDVLRWRKQLNFIPLHMSLDKADYVLAVLSDKAYYQMYIEIAVSCADDIRKQKMIENMLYFWDFKISKQRLIDYYPAYYVFYTMDKAAFVENHTK